MTIGNDLINSGAGLLNSGKDFIFETLGIKNAIIAGVSIGFVCLGIYTLVQKSRQKQIAAEIKTLHQNFTQYYSRFNLPPAVTGSEYFKQDKAAREAPISD